MTEEIKASISKWIGRDYIEATSRRLLTTAMDEIERLEAGIKALEAERDHWKANHAAQVERARILIERPDMPIERVKAYAQIGRMRAALESIASLKATALEMVADQSIPESPIVMAGFKDAVRIARNALKEQ